jgi:D-glycero-alpha-D-manno-heptose-7-phosphate kinase
MYKKIVVTKTPLRVSFLGGGTDIENFYKKYSGLSISSTINKFIYVTVKEHGKLFNRRFRLSYSKTENKNKLDNIQNDIVRETLKLIKVDKPLYISSISDIPSNSGLGSSSAFTVGLVKALYEFKNIKISNLKIAKIACKIEIERVLSPIGKQDQYSTALGGFNCFFFKKNSRIYVKKINKISLINKIFENSVFIWIGQTRKTNNILIDQNKSFNFNIQKLIKIKKLANNFLDTLNKKSFSLDEIAKLIDNSWSIKQSLSKKINNKKIKKIYNESVKNGCLGGKVLGAGGGGFLLVLIKKSKIKNFIKKMRNYDDRIIITKFKFEPRGSQVILSL